MEIVIKIAPIILALIMLGLGFGLKLEDFYKSYKNSKRFFYRLFISINYSASCCVFVNFNFKKHHQR
jgi:predicted Na+-dependent transporter